MENLFEFEMRKRLEEKMEEYRKEIEKKQDLALLIESLVVLKTYSVKSDNDLGFYELNQKEGYALDLANQTYIRLIDKLLDDLIKQNFIIDLNNTSIGSYYEDSQKLKEVNSIAYQEIDRQYQQMEFSFWYIHKCMKTDKVDFIELLIKRGQYDVIIELLLSSKVTDEQKFHIVDVVVKKYASNLKEIFKTIPASYCDQNKYNKDNQEEFRKILDQNLQQVFDGKETYIKNVIVDKLRTSCEDCTTSYAVNNVVKFFVEHNLIDINTIIWEHKGKKVTTAAAAYVMGKEDLAKYLYSLPEYLNNDKLIKDTSDMVVAGHIIASRYPYEIYKFIDQPNYTSDKEKFFCVMEMIDERIKHDNENFLSCTIDAESVMNILLRKTKKEDYKKIKEEYKKRENKFADSKKEEELLKNKRQEFVSVISLMSESLLEQVPAKKKIKELEFIKK